MKFSALIVFILLPAAGFAGTAQTWSEITDTGVYVLSQDLVLQNQLSFHAGEKFSLQEASGLGSVAAAYFEFKALQCAQPQRVITDFEMIRPAQTPAGRDGSVGVLLDPQCVLKIYVDLGDLNSPALFMDSAK